MEPTESSTLKNSENIPKSAYPEHELSDGELFSRDLDRINLVIVNMLRDSNTDDSDLKQAWTVRAVLAEDFVNSLEPSLENPDPRSRVLFDVMVDKAIIFEATDNNVQYLEELDAAEAFALGNNFDEVTDSIGKELDEKIKELGSSLKELILKLRGVIEFSNRDYLRELLAEGMDYNDFIGTIYGMILERGGTPDDILMQLGITE